MENIYRLLAVSPLDGRYQSKVKELKDYFSEYALIKYRTRVEIEWLISLADNEEIDCLQPFSEKTQNELREIWRQFSPKNGQEVKDIEAETNHDVKATEYFINKKLRAAGMESVCSMTHFACTSEDISNLAYALILKDALKETILPVCGQLLQNIRDKSEEYRRAAMLSRTHGQPASPTTMGKEFHNVAERLERQLRQIQEQSFLGKINGAVGNFNAHLVSFPNVDWEDFSRNFVESLGVDWNPATTQIEPHDYMAEIFHQFIRWNTILLDFNRDIWTYISMEIFKQVMVENEIGSSTMPHKINPIDFENSEGNLGIANALFEHLAAKLPVSRMQRDLTDSTVLRNVGIAFGYSLLAFRSALKGLNKLTLNEDKLRGDLDKSWETLGEALQTVMRKYQISSPYEKLKELTRGKSVDRELLHAFIESLDLPEEVKTELKLLTPFNYLGRASEF